MTNLQNCLDSCSIYVGTYQKYNNGSLYGKWLNLADYSDYDGQIEAMKDLHEDENVPKFMLQDHELCEIFEKLGLIGDSYISKDIYEIAEQINDSGYDIEVFESYVDCVRKMDFQSVYDGVMNYYIGEYSDDETFVQELCENDTPYNLPSYICIDWDATARNIMFDYFESNGHYFRS